MEVKDKYLELPAWQVDDLFEERAAIIEFDAGWSKYDSEQMAAQMMGFTNKSDLKRYVQERKAFEKNNSIDG